MSDFDTLSVVNLESLKDCRIIIVLFKEIFFSNSCLHSLLPSVRNNEVMSKLRNPTKIASTIYTPEPKDISAP